MQAVIVLTTRILWHVWWWSSPDDRFLWIQAIFSCFLVQLQFAWTAGRSLQVQHLSCAHCTFLLLKRKSLWCHGVVGVLPTSWIKQYFIGQKNSKASVVFLKSNEITNVYIHSRVRYDLCHMPFVRKVVDNLNRPNFVYCNSFPTVAIKTSPNIITYHQINRDVRVWYKQCITRKWCTLALMLKGYLGIW